ncbi:MAG: hypothetical protein WC966_06090 [Bradymonadales bacterium]|jgi:hypothetical protein
MKAKRLFKLLIVLYGLWFFFLGASYIYQANRYVKLRLQVAGTGQLAPGLTNIMRVWASHDEKDYDFSAHSVSYILNCKNDNSNELRGSTELSAQGQGVLRIAVPNATCSEYFMQFTLHSAEGESLKVADLYLPQGGELKVLELKTKKGIFFDSRQLNPFFRSKPSDIIVALFDENHKPYRESVQLSLKYGGGAIPQSIRCNRFGLAGFAPAVMSEADIELSLKTSDDQDYKRYIVLSLLGANLKLKFLNAPILEMGKDLAIELETMGGTSTIFSDIFYQNAWIERQVFSESKKMQRLAAPKLEFDKPQILSINACTYDWDCADAANKKNIIYSPYKLALRDAVDFALIEFKLHAPTHPVVQLLEGAPELLANASEDELTLLLNYILATLPSNSAQVRLLLHTDSSDKAKIESEKAQHKISANILFLITVMVGALVLLVIFLRSRAEKRLIYQEDDDEPTQKPQIDFSLIVIIFSLIAMIAGFFYLFQII